MTFQFGGSETNQKTIIGHPVGLFVLFFTEMWERFSYYGMRGILVLFLTSTLIDGGFGWDNSQALMLYGWYTGLVYLTPLLGGWWADKKIGYRNAVVTGAFLMTLGHVSLALEMVSTFYLGLALLIIGTGYFKPNIASIVGQMYPKGSQLKDSAYTIFYMGVNSGAFLGILICGWLGETKGWSYGFGCAGIFMFFGLLQFWVGQKIYGSIGLKPSQQPKEKTEVENTSEEETAVPFTKDDRNRLIAALLVGIATIIAWQAATFDSYITQYSMVIPFLLLIVIFIVKRLRQYPTVERDRLSVIAIFAFFVIFFWLAFEQAGGTMNLFARDFTSRGLVGETTVLAFRIISLALTIIPMLILTWVLIQLARHILRKFPLTILFTGISFFTIWGIIYTINYENFSQEALEIPASWFGSLNAFFIVVLAPAFSWLWLSLDKIGKNPTGPVKLAAGLFLLGIGFITLASGALPIPQGASSAQVNMIWLIMAYFFHTVGELCLSPVGLSFVNKLSPTRLLGLMFGVWFLANFVANFLAGFLGSFIDKISETTSLSGFFSIFVVSSFVAGIALLILNKRLVKMMHGVT